MIEMHINGLEELDAKLKEVAYNLQPEQTEPVLLGAADLVADTMRGLAPVGPTGNFKKSIRSTNLLARGNSTAAIGAINYRIAPHAYLVMYGTGERIAGAIKDTGQLNLKSMKSMKKGVFLKHFGRMPANPVLQNAYEQSGPQAQQMILDGVTKLIEGSFA